MGTNFINIGKGMYRITVRSKAKRDRLARIPGVQVKGTRVIFPEWLVVNIKRIIDPPQKKMETPVKQTDLFQTIQESIEK
ncbi:hypothetical protein ACFL60_01075 [Candidatus Omnitrophota bacterium]